MELTVTIDEKTERAISLALAERTKECRAFTLEEVSEIVSETVAKRFDDYSWRFISTWCCDCPLYKTVELGGQRKFKCTVDNMAHCPALQSVVG